MLKFCNLVCLAMHVSRKGWKSLENEFQATQRNPILAIVHCLLLCFEAVARKTQVIGDLAALLALLCIALGTD